jgi:peptide-methionine (S)-S-oxide reductase
MAVFYQNDQEKQAAEAYIRQLTDAKVYDKPIQTTVESMPEGFFPAEAYHQHFVSNNPDHPYVCTWSVRKIARIRAAFPDQVKAAEQTPPNK